MNKIIRGYLFITVSILFLCGVFAPEKADAMGWPHNNISGCSTCHGGGFTAALYGFDPKCLDCHDSGGSTDAQFLPFDGQDAANPFGTFSANIVSPKQISHSWGVPYKNFSAGASRGNRFVSTRATNLSCASCHYAHRSLHPKGLRIWTDASAESLQRNGLCISCHSARDVTKADGNVAPKTNSHPVNVQFSDITGHTYPPNIDAAYDSISSSVLKLFSTVGGKDTVHCKTCHGVHYTDSNPFTNDAPLANLSTGDGYLLRRYNDSTMCNDCHDFQGHGNTGNVMTCRNCHQPHNVGSNTKLIMQNISTPVINVNNYGSAPVLKLYTARGFVTDDRDGTGICEVCHSLSPTSASGDPIFRRWSSNHSGRKADEDPLPLIISQASNFNCMNCHPHAVGPGMTSFMPSGGACSICHGQPPQKNYTGTEVDGGYAWFADTGMGYADTGVFKNESTTPHKTHAVEYDFGNKGTGYGTGAGDGKCRACHNAPTASHQEDPYVESSFQDVEFGLHSTSAGAGKGTYTPASGLCTSLYCHSNGDPLNGGNSYTNPTWSDNYTETTCNSCHTNPPATNVHAKHTDAPYSFDCAFCHSNTVTDNSTISGSGKSTYHVNREKDVFFSGPADDNGAIPDYDPATNKCSDVWCHGGDNNNTDDPNMMNNTTVQWDGASPCGSCHNSPQDSSSHTKHLSYGFECSNCHEATMDVGDDGAIAAGGYATHVDGAKSVDFGVARGTINNAGAVAYVDGTDECDNIYCHSRGTDLTAPFNTAEGDPESRATWGGTGTCNYCHGSTAYSGYTAAMPNYVSGVPKPNSHKEHVVDNGFGCKVCHTDTTLNNYSINDNSFHVNMLRDVNIDADYGGTWDGTKCTNVSCHGGNNSPNWGDPVNCMDCHYSSTAADQNNDTTWNNFSGAAQQIYSSDFNNIGHGKTSGSYPYTNLPAASKVCTDCHDDTTPVPHGVATNPYRLKYKDETNAFCLSCHGSGSELASGGPFATMSGIQNHSYANISTNGYKNLTTWRFIPKCVDCHDPHGDSNLAMIQSKVQTGGSDDEGKPDPFVNGSTVVFTKFTGAAGSFSYATPDITSLCRTCHTRTKFHKTDGGVEHNSDVSCINCHKHNTGFTPAGCELGCHGYPPRNPAQLLYSSANSDRSGDLTGSVTAGAHETHVEYAGQVCENCHNGGMGAVIQNDGTITLDIQAYTQYSTGYYDGQIAVDGGAYGYAGPSAGTANDDKKCSLVKCHGDGTPKWLSNGANNTPTWDIASTGDCGNCHGAKKAPTSGVGATLVGYPITNAHQKHAGYASEEYDMMCKTCHNATVLTSATTLASTHVNAQALVNFTTESRLDDNPTYDGDVTVNSGFGTDGCINTYCHSRAHSTTKPYSTPNVKMKWDFGASSCNSCHGSTGVYGGYTAAVPNYASGSPKVNSHIEHVVDQGINCSYCHYDTTTDGRTINNVTSHVNKQYDVVIKDGAASYASPNCSNVDCHNSSSVDWGAANPGCISCHNTSSDTDNFTFDNFSSPNTNAAKINSSEWTVKGHGNSTTYGSGNSGADKGCTACHDASKGHDQSAFRLLSTDNPDTLCLFCHGSSSDRKASWGPFNNTTGYQTHSFANISIGGYRNMSAWTFTPKCIDCHDPHGDKNRYMIQTFSAYSGSDADGRPYVPNTVQTNFTTMTNGLLNWSSYVNDSDGANPGEGLCQRCHGTRVLNFDKGGELNLDHNRGQRCTACHNHKTGFTPSGGCADCHFAAADVDDFVYQGGSQQAKINQTQYTSVGHGKWDLECLQCHNENITHDTAGNYFRLYTGDTNALCANCHGDTGAATYAAWTSGVDTWAVSTKTGIFTHSTTVMATGRGHQVQIKCVDCHDPHGDNNIFMLHSTFALPNAANNYTPSNVFGIPTSTQWSNVDFTTNANGFGYATSVAVDGISRVCNVCHMNTVDPLATSNQRFQRDMASGSRDVHNTDKKCVSCHAHSGGFKGIACDGCHGNPPINAATLIDGASTNHNKPASGSLDAGAHFKHVTVLTDTDTCKRCHDTGMSVTGDMAQGVIDVEFAGGTQNRYTTGSYGGQNLVDSGPYGYEGDVALDNTMKCTSVKCHGAAGAWLTKNTAPAIVDPVWTGSIVCGDCHGAKKTSGSGTWPTSGGHAKHAGTGPDQYDFMCQACHAGTLSNNTTLSTLHVNELSEVAFDYTNDNRLEDTSIYDGGNAVNSAVGKCNLTYCHSDGNRFDNFSLPNTVPTTPQWDAGTLGCNACHAGIGTGPDYTDDAPKANSHATHVVTKSYTCSDCHQATTTDNATISDESVHVNKFYNISVEVTYAVGAGPRYVYNAAGGTCSDIYCHGAAMVGTAWEGSDTTPQWGDNTTAACGDCHVTSIALGDAADMSQGGHLMHVQQQPNGYEFACSKCHSASTTGTATHVNTLVNFTTVDSELNDTGVCAAYCHESDAIDAKQDWYSSAGNRTRTCGETVSCHSGKDDEDNMPGRHPKHVSLASEYQFDCVRCHELTVSGNTTIDATTGRFYHADGTKTVDFDNSGGIDNSGGNFPGGSQCTNIYCHSNGTDQVAPNYPMGNYTADWDDNPLSARTGAGKECQYCHGDKGSAFTGITSAMPNYATGAKKNSHPTHAILNQIKCQVCHNLTLAADGSINDQTKHVNMAYDVDIADPYDTNGGTSNFSAGQCNSISCHGTGTPTWGDDNGTLICSDCHLSASADVDDFVYGNYTMALINSTEWTTRGHGNSGSYPHSSNSGANKACADCHRASVNHGTGSNPFRLYTAPDRPNMLCETCHDGATAVIAFTHSSTVMKAKGYDGGATGWAAWDLTPKCVDCHDPHGDNNNYMISKMLNYSTNSDTYGTPDKTKWTQITYSSAGGVPVWGDYVKDSTFDGICQRCHTPTVSEPGIANFTKTEFNGSHNSGTRCTTCHSHTNGFYPVAAESPGDVDCGGCHGGLFKTMTSDSSYHHAMQNTSSTYSNATSLEMTDTRRRCLMCHVDHDVFSPGVAGQQRGRAMNLLQAPRALANVSGINTDFWPANPKYDATNPVSGGTTDANGICVGCHTTEKVKNTTNRGANDGSSKARGFNKYMFYSSSHNFQIIDGMSLYSSVDYANSSGAGTSFRANCSKCHGSKAFDKTVQSGARFKFGLHDRKEQSLLQYSSSSVQIEQLCYKCHDSYVTRNRYDFYSSVPMSDSAKLIKTAIVAKKSGHPIDSVAAEGRHLGDEYYDATEGSWNPSTSRHVECVDCHNTHGGNANRKRYPGGPYKGKYTTGGYYNAPEGGLVAGAQKGAWGVSLDYASSNAGEVPAFTKEPEVTYQYELCIKCHSYYAYGNSPSGAPSGLPDEALATAAPYDVLDSTVPQADISKMINEKNYGFHPIYKKGRNQPGKSLNSNWPTLAEDVKYYNTFENRTAFVSVSGLSWTFVPPYNQHSILACSDCHQADNTGNALGKIIYKPSSTAVDAGTWSTAPSEANLYKADENFAVTGSGCTNCTITIELDYPGASYPANEPTDIYLVSYGYSGETGKNNRNHTMELWDNTNTTQIGTTQTVPLPYGTVASASSRADAALGTAQNWSVLDDQDHTVKWLSDTSNGDVIRIDYMGIEALYQADGDIRGPHGSLERWILTDADQNVWFDADRDGNLDNTNGVTGDKINADITDTYELKNFCYNCHRRDVYSAQDGTSRDDATRRMSRAAHPLEGGGRDNDPTKNVWGIWCMNCHGGGGKGVIHGSFANSTTPDWWWGATRTDLNRPRGVRLLQGALFAFDPSGSGTCYTPNVTSAYNSGCDSQHEAGVALTGGSTNYAYTTW